MKFSSASKGYSSPSPDYSSSSWGAGFFAANKPPVVWAPENNEFEGCPENREFELGLENMFPPPWLKRELLCPAKIPPVAAFFKKDWANSAPETLAKGLPNREGGLGLELGTDVGRLKGEVFVWRSGFENKLGVGWLAWLVVNRLAGGLLVWIFVNKLEAGSFVWEFAPKNAGVGTGCLLALSVLLNYPEETTGFVIFPKNGTP